MNKKMFKIGDVTTIVEHDRRDYYRYEGLVKSKDSEFKFRIVCEFSNGTPCGFDYNHCIDVLSTDGTWKHVADRHSILPVARNKADYVSQLPIQVAYKNEFVTASLNYLNLVYGN